MALRTQSGRSGQWRQVITVAPTITAGAYSLNDALGGLLTFANASHGAGESGVVEALRLVDRAQQRPPLELFLFDQTFTAMVDNAAWDPSDADLDNCIGHIIIPADAYTDNLDNSVATVKGIELPYVTVGSYNIYGQLVIRGGPPTFIATSDMRVRLSVVKD